MKLRLQLAFGLGLALVAACGGSVETSPSGAGGSSSVTTGSAMTTTSTGNGGSCPGFEDAPGTGPVTVRFHNKTPSPLYLPGRCADVDYTIVPIDGTNGVTYNFDSSCLQTCAELQTSPPFVCGACPPRSYRIEPGATLEASWDGTGLKPDVQMPLSCWRSPPSQNTCHQIVAAPAGTYRINVFGYSSCGANCACDKGVCAGSTEGNQAFPDPVKFELPATNAVDVVFDVCAFGCAGD